MEKFKNISIIAQVNGAMTKEEAIELDAIKNMMKVAICENNGSTKEMLFAIDKFNESVEIMQAIYLMSIGKINKNNIPDKQSYIDNIKIDNRNKKKQVYIISIGNKENVYKIGVSSNVENRIKTLQTGNPFGLKIIATTSYIDNPFEIEKRILDEYIENSIGGEWIRLNHNQIKDIIYKYAMQEFKQIEG